MSGVRTNQIFYEGVRVLGDALAGEENRGWYTVTHALDHERVALAPWLPPGRWRESHQPQKVGGSAG